MLILLLARRVADPEDTVTIIIYLSTYRYLPQYPLLPIEFIIFVIVFEDGRNVLDRKFVLTKSVEEASFATGTIPNNH